MRVGIYARVSTLDQQTLPMQLKAMRGYVRQRMWKVALQVEEVGSGAKQRPKREELMKAARRREVDYIIVWKLDRWGRSVADLITTLAELRDLGIGFVSLTEALDFTTASGRLHYRIRSGDGRAVLGLRRVRARHAQRAGEGRHCQCTCGRASTRAATDGGDEGG